MANTYHIIGICLHIIWLCLQKLYEFRFSIGAFFLLLFTAGAKTAPCIIPKTRQDYWTWGYDWVHQYFNLQNNRPKTPQEEEILGKSHT